jgi:phosphatidylglycerol---prolipoprotein diacylglyceryl transferase
MHPHLVPSLHIGSYSVLLLLGIFLGYLTARILARRSGIEPRHIDNLALLCAAAGLFGARFFSTLFYMPGATFRDALQVWNGSGLVFYGGLLFGAAAMVAYGCAMRLPLRHLADVLAPGAALGLAAGRVGCFLAGCCWGDVCIDPHKLAAAVPDPVMRQQVQTMPAISGSAAVWAVQFPESSAAYKQHARLGLVPLEEARSIPVHPVQLYEAGFGFSMAILLWHRFRRRRFAGEAALLLVLSYSFARFGLEFLRADSHPAYYGLSLSQAISLGMAGAALIVCGWLITRKSLKESPSCQTQVRKPVRA